MNTWKSVAKIKKHFANEKFEAADKMLAQLPDNFSHKYYLMGVSASARNDDFSALANLTKALSLAEDPDLRKSYMRTLLNLRFSGKLNLDYFEELLRRKVVRKALPSTAFPWHLPKNSPGSFKISPSLLESIIKTKRSNPLSLSVVNTAWEAVSDRDEGFLSKDEGFDFQLDDLIGSVGSGVPSIGMRLEYLSFLSQGTVDENYDSYSDLVLGSRLSTDLGSRVDIQILDNAVGIAPAEVHSLNILEVGGGYGRLCESMVLNSRYKIHNYFLVDAVPSSIAAAYTYLSENLPSANISIIGTDSVRTAYEEDRSGTNIFIVPSWELDAYVFPSIDIGINIESFQEMSPEWVSFYMGLFDQTVSDDGFVYLSNSRCYKNQSMPEIGEGWDVQLFIETPRSWTRDHPTIVLTKPTNLRHFSKLRNSYVEPWKIVI